ncbi:helix-turn-helix transcriptional regulator [Paenibacillus sp.]|uniref:helix-turn-helix transcriptional regulator n=1 Tax=Paenibacillus sp. TaxID=58172 RepID=UPI002D593CE0|nr:helix-turn-helix transcriptional regulator [Paenibacillus sp.]HZG87296.1 helix-turn-helix transcriptional regulator [Paenibacillus sp.]
MDVDNATFKKIRKVYALSCSEMGSLLDVSTTLVSYIERERRTLTPEIRRKVIDEFELTPEKLAKILEVYEEYHAAPRR